MSTNLVAFLLLHQWRRGVSMPLLVQSFQQLVTDLLAAQYDVGFSGKIMSVLAISERAFYIGWNIQVLLP